MLLRCIIGLLPPKAGTVRLFGDDLYKADDRELDYSQGPWLRNYLLGARTRAGGIPYPTFICPSPWEFMS